MTNDINNENHTGENKPTVSGSAGTGALSSIIFLVVVIIFMLVLAHFKGA